MPTATQIRSRLKALPKSLHEEHEDFCIRLWRSASWLERAERMGNDDLEGRFISAWIAFNALYGRRDDANRPWGDREALNAFLAQVWRLDQQQRIRRVLGKRQLQVLKLIENKYLSTRFWRDGEPAARYVKKELRQAMNWYGTPKMPSVLVLLFDRLYTMRNQVLHGASTKGGYLNRRTLQGSGSILLDLLPEMLAIMLEDGIEVDWGWVCFPPS